MVHHNECPLCTSEKISLLFRCTDNFISKEVFGVYRCDSCSFEFTQDYPDVNEIDRYYQSDDYISHSDTSRGITNKIYRLARNLMLNKKRVLINNATGLQNGSLLDIGSGTGHFAATMKRAGWKVKGIEINKKAQDFSRSKFGLDITGPEQIQSMETNSFDCITLWHVLEHFHDPAEYISNIKHLLKPAGLCFIALPNCSSYDALYYRQFWAAYDVPRHLWHFNPSTFRIFLEKTGLVIEKMMVLPADVYYISILSERYKRSKIPFLSGLIKASLFTFLTFFRTGRSSSVIYILRKSVDQ